MSRHAAYFRQRWLSFSGLFSCSVFLTFSFSCCTGRSSFVLFWRTAFFSCSSLRPVSARYRLLAPLLVAFFSHDCLYCVCLNSFWSLRLLTGSASATATSSIVPVPAFCGLNHVHVAWRRPLGRASNAMISQKQISLSFCHNLCAHGRGLQLIVPFQALAWRNPVIPGDPSIREIAQEIQHGGKNR